MSTSPSPAVFSPIPQRAAGSAASTAATAAAQAAGYAAGWAQGVAAAAAAERVALAEVAATAAAEREQLLTAALAALSALDAAAAQMRSRVAPGVDEAVDVLAAAAVDLAEVVVGQHVADAAGGADRGRAALDRALAERASAPSIDPDPFAPPPHACHADEDGSPTSQRSHAAGYAAGWAQGVAAAAVNERAALEAHEATAEVQRDQLRRAFDRALSALDDAAAQMRGRIVPTVDATADVLVAAAADLAEMLVGHELTDSRTRGRRALERALAAAPEHSDVVVSLHPLDLQLLEQAGVTGATASSRGRTVQLTQDAALHPGDALAHFPGGQVDARVSTAMARLRSSLRSAERAAASGAAGGEQA